MFGGGQMFSGMSSHSIDSKGRIILPAKFREQLGDTFYLAKGFSNCCIQAMSIDEFNSACEKIQELPTKNATALQYIFNASAVEVTPNAQGRVLLPQMLRDFAGVESDALVIGMNKRVEIWNQTKFDDYMANQQDAVADALSMLKL